MEGSCECVLEMVTPSAGGQCLGLSPGKAMSQQGSSVAQSSLQGPWSAIPICSGLNLNFSFLDHTMGLIRVPNSCVTEKRQSSLSSSQHRVWHMVGALWGSKGAAVPDRAPPSLAAGYEQQQEQEKLERLTSSFLCPLPHVCLPEPHERWIWAHRRRCARRLRPST